MESSRRLNNILHTAQNPLHPDIHAQEVLCQVCSLQLTLAWCTAVNFKPELFQIPVFGTFGIHHGKVPEDQGRRQHFKQRMAKTAGVTIKRSMLD
jgi:hypothetical protein